MATADRGTPEGAGGGMDLTDAGTTFLPPQPAEREAHAGVQPAGWWARVGASLLDAVLISVLMVPVALLVATSDTAVLVAAAVVLLGYPALMLAYNHGQTLGKAVARVRVIGADGQPVGLGRAFGRELVKVVFNYTGVIGIIDVLWPLWQAENRALHDLIAGTRVVQAQPLPSGYESVSAGERT